MAFQSLTAAATSKRLQQSLRFVFGPQWPTAATQGSSIVFDPQRDHMLDLLDSSPALNGQHQRQRVASQFLTAAAPSERPHALLGFISWPSRANHAVGIAQLSQQLSKALTPQGGSAVYRSSIALLGQHFVGLPPDTGIALHDSAHHTNSAFLPLQEVKLTLHC